MTAPAASRLSRVDTAWLRMDNDVNRMMIVGVWLLEPALPLAALRARIADKLLQYPRFRQQVVIDAHGASWVDDPGFDIARHVVPERLARRRAQPEADALKARCGELATAPLDPARPLWQFHHIARYGRGSAVVLRIHHCIGDGIALIAVMNSITDGGTDPPRPADPHAEADHEHDGLVESLLRPLTGAAVRALDAAGDGAVASIDALADPGGSLAGSIDLARAGARLVGDLAALALMADDSPTRLKGRLAGRKRVAWGPPLPLDAVKAVGRAFGTSVNDVLLASVAGALGGWLRAQGGEGLDDAGLRAMVPVNLRPPEQAWRLGNRFGLAPLLLPVGIANPVERLYAVHARMAALKDSFQPLLSYGVLALAGFAAQPVQDALLGLFAKKATAVMTNVPGPRKPLSVCGRALVQSMFWVPASGEIGVGVSVLSYAGGVQFGLITDEALCDDPQAVVDRFAPEFEQLLLLALMLPWRLPAGDAAAAG